MKYPFSSALAAALLGLVASGAAPASEKLAIQAGCAACHAPAKKVIGPAYRDIAIKYKGQPQAVALLSERIRKGGKGVWGEVPMAPTPAARLNDADLKALVTWVLKTPA
jgi:cytochrome c